ncbi:MAG: helix-turn-helix transcriptional regulator [Methanotrichaceae archaeon]
MSACDKYDLTEDKLKGFTRSSVRTKIMLCLKDHEKESGELEAELKMRSTTILHSIKDMIEDDLVKKEKGIKGYSLTNIGMIEALLLDKLISAIVIIDKHKDFWLNHDVSGIPKDLLDDIGILGESTIIESDPADLLKITEHAIDQITKAKEVHGVSPIIVPGFPAAIELAIKNGAKVELAVTDSILKEVAQKYPNVLNHIFRSENFRLYRLSDNIKVAFTVMDSMLSLGLFRLDGGYDLGSDLICVGDAAAMWGLELFQYYVKKADPIESIDKVNDLMGKI